MIMKPDLRLDQFFPYQLAVLAEAVSRATALVYTERFNLGRDEWRVLAALANRERMKTVEVIAHTTLDKMQVSRALARMVEAALVERTVDPNDRRSHELRLTPAGISLYRKIVPRVQARADHLLAELSEAERELFSTALQRILVRAQDMLVADRNR